MKPYQLGLVQTRDAVREGELSPLDVVTSVVDHLDATEPRLKAWEHLDVEGALAAARALEAKTSDGLPLRGVVAGLKDVFHVAGMPTRAGFEPYRGRVARQDSAAATALRHAGAVILGKTVATQLAVGSECPVSVNPWAADCTPGGSSSGSAVAVGAWQVPLALGTQTGGSLLRPAGYCGAVAFKPSYGRISRDGVLPVSWSLDHVGVITRCVRDAAVAAGVLAAEDFEPRRTEAPELAVLTDLLALCDPHVREATERALALLESAGACLREVSLPVPMARLQAMAWVIRTAELGAVHAPLHERFPEAYEHGPRTSVEAGQILPAWAYVEALRQREVTRPAIAGLFTGIDAVVAPTGPDVPPPRASGTGRPDFQTIWSVHGLPNISLPCGLSEQGYPNAIQLVGAAREERRLLGAAEWCEGVLGSLPEPNTMRFGPA